MEEGGGPLEKPKDSPDDTLLQEVAVLKRPNTVVTLRAMAVVAHFKSINTRVHCRHSVPTELTEFVKPVKGRAKRCPVCDFLEFLLVSDAPDLILLQEIHADEVRSKAVIRSLGQCQDSFAQLVAGASRGRSFLMDKGILYMEIFVVLQGLRLTAADGTGYCFLDRHGNGSIEGRNINPASGPLGAESRAIRDDLLKASQWKLQNNHPDLAICSGYAANGDFCFGRATRFDHDVARTGLFHAANKQKSRETIALRRWRKDYKRKLFSRSRNTTTAKVEELYAAEMRNGSEEQK
ncbi:hypothetical protein MUK42_02062, partial [Musa troglodytarum]